MTTPSVNYTNLRTQRWWFGKQTPARQARQQVLASVVHLDKFTFWSWNVKDPPAPWPPAVRIFSGGRGSGQIKFHEIGNVSISCKKLWISLPNTKEIRQFPTHFQNRRETQRIWQTICRQFENNLQTLAKIPPTFAIIFSELFLTFWALSGAEVGIPSGAKECTIYRSRKMLPHEYSFANIGLDTT